MAEAVLSAAPMPWPISLYQGPLSAPAMSMPAAFHSASSAACVPERSPREMKGAPFALMAVSAATMSLVPLTPAGSLSGPMRTKSLYMTGNRFTPNPSAMNFSSCGLACTNTTSASPRRPVSSAWPVPCAITFTSMPVFALNSGRIWPNSPESWVDVVEATTIDFSCAEAGVATDRRRARPANAWINFMLRSICLSYQQFAGDEFLRFRGARCGEELLGARVLDDAPAMHQHDVGPEPARLAEIVGRHHHSDAAACDRADDLLDRLGGGGIKAGRGLVEEQHVRVLGEGTCERQPLLLAAREAARRPSPQPAQA